MPPMPAFGGFDLSEPIALTIGKRQRHDTPAVQTKIGIPVVGRTAPHDLALRLRRRGEYGGLPNHRALAIRVMSPHIAALLPSHQDALALRQRLQDRRRAEIVIGAG